MTELEERLGSICGQILRDLRPRSIVDRKKFVELYLILRELSKELGNTSDINRSVLRPIILLLFQLSTQSRYAKEEKQVLISTELHNLLTTLLDSGLFDDPLSLEKLVSGDASADFLP